VKPTKRTSEPGGVLARGAEGASAGGGSPAYGEESGGHVKRSRWNPQRTEGERQALIDELRRWQRLGSEVPDALVEMRRIEQVLRLDWEQGWPEGPSVSVSPKPYVGEEHLPRRLASWP
jgi:hypothetical protein